MRIPVFLPSICLLASLPTLAGQVRPGHSSIEITNSNAKLLRTGNLEAGRQLSRTLFEKIGLGRDFADSFGFTDRISQADLQYRRGEKAGVSEQQVLTALNNFASRTAPLAWVKTTPEELRRLRMLLVATYPHMMASQAAPDEHGKYKAVDDTMSPMEASYLAATMLYQKAFNPDFQLNQQEKQSLEPAAANQLHLSRTHELQEVFAGHAGGSSLNNLMAAGDAMFTDIGVPQIANASKQGKGGNR